MVEGFFLLGGVALCATSAFVLFAVLSCMRIRDGIPWLYLWMAAPCGLCLYFSTFPWDGAYPLANGIRAAAMMLVAAAIGALLGRAAGALFRRVVERI